MYTSTQEYPFTGSLYLSGPKNFKNIVIEKIDIIDADINWKVKLPNDTELLCDSIIQK